MTDNDLIDAIRTIRSRYPAYGYRRLVALFQVQGVAVSARQIRRVMRAMRD